jgi:hypothetical protein
MKQPIFCVPAFALAAFFSLALVGYQAGAGITFTGSNAGADSFSNALSPGAPVANRTETTTAIASAPDEPNQVVAGIVSHSPGATGVPAFMNEFVAGRTGASADQTDPDHPVFSRATASRLGILLVGLLVPAALWRRVNAGVRHGKIETQLHGKPQ